MRCLLINPWIADISAYNFWVRPLGLYALAEWLWERGCEVDLIDCLSPAPAPGRFPRQVLPTPATLRGMNRRFARYGVALDEFRQRVADVPRPDRVLLTSAMAYWYPGVRWATDEIRSILPGVPIGIGGVYPSLWPEHAAAWSGGDRVFPGPLESAETALAGFLGVPSGPIRERVPWHQLDLHDGASYAGVRTARGCPFRCTYCAAHRLSPEFQPREPVAVVEELSALHTLGVTDVAFYDDALLMNFDRHLGEILKSMQHRGLDLRFHAPNGLHARLIDREAAEALVAGGFTTIRLSLETVDVDRQRDTGGKVSSAHVERAVRELCRAGANPASIGVYVMVGLPGQNLEEVENGVRFATGLGTRPHLCEFSPIPGTPDWGRLVDAGIITPDLDPLLTNNSVFLRLFGAWPREELEAKLTEWRALFEPGPPGRG